MVVCFPHSIVCVRPSENAGGGSRCLLRAESVTLFGARVFCRQAQCVSCGVYGPRRVDAALLDASSSPNEEFTY